MKKIIISSVLVFITVLLGFVGYKSIKNHYQKKIIAKKTQTLPEFSFYTLENQLFSTKELKPETSVIISYFHPECEHCQYEAKDMVKHQQDFKNTQILMISPADINEIQQFAEKCNLQQLQNLIILHDTAYVFEDTFGESAFPTLFIYSKQHQLIKKFSGEVKAVKIIEILNQ